MFRSSMRGHEESISRRWSCIERAKDTLARGAITPTSDPPYRRDTLPSEENANDRAAATTKNTDPMDRDPGRLLEQLQQARFRQRKIIQQLQADNIRLLGDLLDVRQERDTFRKEAARVRKENAELRNSLEEALTRCRDFKREQATLVRPAANVGSAHAAARSGRDIHPVVSVALGRASRWFITPPRPRVRCLCRTNRPTRHPPQSLPPGPTPPL